MLLLRALADIVIPLFGQSHRDRQPIGDRPEEMPPEMPLHRLRQSARAVVDEAERVAGSLKRMEKDIALIRRDALLLAHTIEWYNATVKDAKQAMDSFDELQ